MGLQFVFGASGAGKSTKVYDKIIAQSMAHPECNYIIMVPDQFTMYTQKELCLKHPRGGIMNVDVLSFSRLTHRIAEEVGRRERAVLDDTGKNLVLRRVAMEKEESLVLLKDKVKKLGYIHEIKSVISEFYQYDIDSSNLEEMIELSKGRGVLSFKLQDLKILYDGFAEYMKEKYITSEEALDELCRMIPKSALLKNSVIVFDGFTGFTPVQNRVLVALMQHTSEVIVTLCADDARDVENEEEQHLFALSAKTYRQLTGFAQENSIVVRESIFLKEKPVKRYEQNPALAFLEANLFRYRKDVFTKKQDSIVIREAENIRSELQGMCLTIKDFIREKGYCYRDIAVVTGDLERYTHLIETEFERYQIPFFMDRNRGIMHHPMTEYLRSALAMRKDNFSYESVFRFLKSGFTNLTMDETDRLENYVRTYGIRGKRAYLSEFERGDELDMMNRIREVFVKEIDPLLGKHHTAKEFATAMYLLCHENRLQEKCMNYAKSFADQNDAARAKEYEKIYPACMDLLNQIYELIGEDEMDVTEFLSVFEAGLSEIRIGTIPQNVDQVVVGDIQRTRLKPVRALFFIGVNDGVIPGQSSGGGLLSDMERFFLAEQGRELAPTPRQKIFEQRLYLYQNMTKPLDYLYISYSIVDGMGKTSHPSYLIGVVKGLFPELKIEKLSGKEAGNLAQIASAEDGLDDYAQLLRVFLNHEMPTKEEEAKVCKSLVLLETAYKNNEVAKSIREASLTTYENRPLSKAAATMLYKERNQGSVSRLEQFAACAYAHFLSYGLELTRPNDYEFDALDFGNIYHHVLERISVKLMHEGVSFAEVEEERLQNLIDKATDEYAGEYGAGILKDSARGTYRITQMKSVLFESIKIMRYQLLQGEFLPEYFEKRFKLKGDFPLVGKVDRIDICRDGDCAYVKVVDYKSGEKKFSYEELYYGLSLQLPAYMNAALTFVKENEPGLFVKPASMLYSRIANIYIESTSRLAEEILKERRKKMIQTGVTDESDEVLHLMDKEFTKSSSVIKVERKADGSLAARSETVTSDMFTTILAYTEHKIGQLTDAIKEGCIEAAPYKSENKDGCMYCPYHGICRIDERIPGYEKREFKKMTAEEVEEEMRNELYGRTAESNNDEE